MDKRSFVVVNWAGEAHKILEESGFERELDHWTDYFPVDFEDEEILNQFVSKHYKKTKSKLAKQILENWDKALNDFIKVFPKEYKQALDAMAKEEQKEADLALA